ncbi:hypothetical protein CHOED_057 [Vibrio phage CHOED]|uniref:hypothetical protein n=1 Tax=Vibrio phage CHOED TaxID=1458716 RepID=UPI00042E7112|nr:hypothetical protein CHOED_057 [Vibrio phage CHOED]AHK11917.1 putative membrane protein [Vibrio phage CHOED]
MGFMICAFGVIAVILGIVGCIMMISEDFKEGGLCLLIALVLGINISLTYDVEAQNEELSTDYQAALVKIESSNKRVYDLILDNSKMQVETSVLTDNLTRLRHNYATLENQSRTDRVALEEAQAKLAKIKVLVNKEK